MFTISRDEPGVALELVRAGGRGRLGWRLWTSAWWLLLGPGALLAGVAWIVDAPLHAPLAVPILGFGLLVNLMFLAATWNEWEPLRVRWDRRAGELGLEVPWLLWLRRELIVPLPALRSVKLEAGPEEQGRPLRLALHLSWEDDGGRTRRGPVALEVPALDRRDEALDLLFRVARVIGWAGWLPLRNEPRLLEAELVRKGKARLVPEVKGPADYTLREVEVARTFEEPARRFEPVDPARLCGEPYELLEWAPGKRVRVGYLHRLNIGPAGAAAGAACVGAFAGAVAGLLLLGPVVELLERPAAAAPLLGALVGAAVGAWRGAHSLRSRAIELDWGRGELRVAPHEGPERRVPLADVEAVVLRGRYRRRGGGRGHPRSTAHLAELDLALPGPDVTLLRTPPCASAEAAHEAGMPAAVELARALGVPVRWEEPTEDGLFAS